MHTSHQKSPGYHRSPAEPRRLTATLPREFPNARVDIQRPASLSSSSEIFLVELYGRQ